MTVRYKSTRGAEANLSFEEVVLAGLATDRGLYVPETVPQITIGQLEKVGDSSVVMFSDETCHCSGILHRH